MRKRLWPIFSRFIEHENWQRAQYEGRQGVLTLIVEIIRTFPWDLRGWQKKSFQKMSFFAMTKVFAVFFFVPSSVTNIREHFIRVHKLFRQILWNLKERFFKELEGCWKHKVLKKRQSFQWWKVSGLFFLVLSIMRNVREQFIRVHKAFW